jgi:hypothetical protein
MPKPGAHRIAFDGRSPGDIVELAKARNVYRTNNKPGA